MLMSFGLFGCSYKWVLPGTFLAILLSPALGHLASFECPTSLFATSVFVFPLLAKCASGF